MEVICLYVRPVLGDEVHSQCTRQMLGARQARLTQTSICGKVLMRLAGGGDARTGDAILQWLPCEDCDRTVHDAMESRWATVGGGGGAFGLRQDCSAR